MKKKITKQHRDESVQIMVTADQRNLIERAAAKKDLTVSTFARTHLVEIAEQIVREKS